MWNMNVTNKKRKRECKTSHHGCDFNIEESTSTLADRSTDNKRKRKKETRGEHSDDR
jgi:hypothetical protein